VAVGSLDGGAALSLEHPRFANEKTSTSQTLRLAYEITRQAP